ncbi:MAG: hypothetical protein ACJASQ_000437 [Crocinitomicaceae bacterium]|jgi:hypothetical protein
MSKVFLSHTSNDKPFVRKLAADLRNYGHTVWIDEAEINIGDSLIGKIRDGLDSVDYVAAILSKESIESEWVKKELEIASNREIKEKKIVVLPILIEDVELPGFLEGKFYGDFSNLDEYEEKLQLLLRSLGDSEPIVPAEKEQLDKIQSELDALKQVLDHYKKSHDKVVEYSLSTKSEELKKIILSENGSNPEYAPINNVYAFEAGEVPITMGYLLHALRKASYKGGHILEWVLTQNNKWAEAERMFAAYADMVKAKKPTT